MYVVNRQSRGGYSGNSTYTCNQLKFDTGYLLKPKDQHLDHSC